MDKSGLMLLTEAEYTEYISGKIPARISQVWGIHSYEELKSVIDSGDFEIISP